eukprot:gene5252-6535_t
MANWNAFYNTLYRSVFRRNSTWVAGVIVGAFALETTVHGVVDTVFESANKGKLWKDVYQARIKSGLAE